ncbi:DUF262 domain-containing protein [Mycobacterium sp. LTG2003]
MKLGKSDLQLETIVSRINAGELDLQPDFQRGEIWDSRRRQRLVDTILREWYIPAVHIVIDHNGREEVLDGQQRLAAIRDFFDNKIPVDGSIEPRDPQIEELDGLRYDSLPDTVKRAVKRFVIQTITLSEYLPQEPNELFFRLNQSYNLTPPEKRNALHGKARDQIKDLVKHLTESGLLKREVIGFANGRLAYDDIVARTCVAVELGTLRTHINNTVVENYYRSSEFSEETIQRVSRAGHVLQEQISSVGDKVRFNKGTLQTWLIYSDWATAITGELPGHLLRNFESDRLALRRGESMVERPVSHGLQEVIRLYDDRASYRVTDVSSVLTRDLAIHLYSQANFSTPEVKRSNRLLSELASSPGERHQPLFFEFIDYRNWGDQLSDVEAAR